MKKSLLIFVLFSTTVALAQTKQTTTPKRRTSIRPKSFTSGKKIIVYTTAENSSDRLTATDTLQFKQMGQPLETQICVFVDPDKTFQNFMGIGGALTDASAETFAKMSKDKQEEILQAYYSVGKGIGYTLASTGFYEI